MSRWSRWKRAWSKTRRDAREREFTDHPWGYPSQAQVEYGYTPGGVDLTHLARKQSPDDIAGEALEQGE
jgi:hypothetical protein